MIFKSKSRLSSPSPNPLVPSPAPTKSCPKTHKILVTAPVNFDFDFLALTLGNVGLGWARDFGLAWACQ